MADSFNTWLATYAIINNIVTSKEVKLDIILGNDHDMQMRSGKYPMGVMNAHGFALAVQRDNLDVVAVSSVIVHEGAKKLEGVNFVMTRAESTINSPTDFVGKKIGLPDPPAAASNICFLALLQENFNISVDDLASLSYFPETILVESIKNGTLDAALIGKNVGPKVRRDPALKEIWNVDKAFVSQFGNSFIASLLVVKSDFYTQNPKKVQAVYELLLESAAYGAEHFDELAPLYAAEKGESVDFFKMIYEEHSSFRLSEIENNVYDSVMGLFGLMVARGVDGGGIASMPDPSVVFKKAIVLD